MLASATNPNDERTAVTVTDYPSFTQSKEFRSDVSIETNFQVDDTTRMSVDAQGAAHIMSLLTDLYSDPEGSVIREYISNAYDSHAAAGQTKPIEVTLPTAFEPKFVIKDYGTGMSATEVREIYGSYGRSTKRDDFTQIGAFGLGCKSALTMTQQFTLISVKDGERTVAIITRGEDGVGEIKIISITDTDEPNGVTVSIPVTEVKKFVAKANDFFYTLPKDSLIVDGELHTKNIYSDDYVEIPGLSTYISRKPLQTRYWDDTSQGFYVVLGGVSYKINYSEINDLVYPKANNKALHENFARSPNFNVYSIIPISSIDLTPSREEVRYSARTKEFLASLFAQISDRFVEVITADVADAPSRLEALKRIKVFSNYIYARYLDGVKWKGEDVVQTIPDTPHAVLKHDGYTTTEHFGEYFLLMDRVLPYRYNDTTSKYYYFKVDASTDTEFEEIVGKIRTKVKGYVNRDGENGIEDDITKVIVFRNNLPTTPWFTELTEIFVPLDQDDFEEGYREWRRWRRKVGAANRTATGTATAITYPVFLLDSEGSLSVSDLPVSDIKKDALVIEQRETHSAFIEVADNNYVHGHHGRSITAALVSQGLHNRQIIFLASSRKFDALVKRLGFTPVTYNSVVAALRDKTVGNVSPLAKSMLRHHRTHRGREQVVSLSKLHPHSDEIGDSDLKELSEAAVEAEEFLALMDGLSFALLGGGGVPGADDSLYYERIKTLERRYPLLDLTHYHFDAIIDHVVTYMKAVNNQRKDA